MCKDVSSYASPESSSASTTKAGTIRTGHNVDTASASLTPVSPSPANVITQYLFLSFFTAIFAVWAKYTFVPEDTATPTVHAPLHSYAVPLSFTAGYLLGLPFLKLVVESRICRGIDMKSALLPSMVCYNVAQVVVNCWMVYRFVSAVATEGHPFVGNLDSTTTTYVLWVHYTNKYLEFLDTVFMVLRGKMDQVSFLHIYHHTTIAWAWWIGLSLFSGGDSYFGALLNSFIHVLMYSYYALSLCKIRCPWKRYLTQAQMVQFTSVLLYSYVGIRIWPKGQREAKHYIAVGVQIWEMSSLLFLFALFYRKSYSKAKGKGKGKGNSASRVDGATATAQEKIRGGSSGTGSTITKVAAAALDAATEDANKIVSTARNVPPVKKVVGATSRPTWSIGN